MMSMLRTFIEIGLVIGLIFGALYINKTLARESRENKARAKAALENDDTTASQ